MSFRAIAWAWEQTTGSAGRKSVLMAVAQFADEAGTCWPSQGYIARYTEQSERTVREHLAFLETDHFLSRKARTNPDGKATSDLITLNFQRQIPPAADFAGGEKPPKPPADSAANTVIEPIKKKKEGEPPRKPITFDFEAGNFVDLDGYRFGRIQEAFPAIDVQAQVARAALWLVAHPKNRKSNYLAFLTNWMSRAQDRAPPISDTGAPSHASARPRTAADKRDDWTDAMFGARRAERDRPANEPPGLFDDQSAR